METETTKDVDSKRGRFYFGNMLYGFTLRSAPHTADANFRKAMNNERWRRVVKICANAGYNQRQPSLILTKKKKKK